MNLSFCLEILHLRQSLLYFLILFQNLVNPSYNVYTVYIDLVYNGADGVDCTGKKIQQNINTLNVY